MDKAEIHRVIYLPQQMILWHQLIQKDHFILCLLQARLFSQHSAHFLILLYPTFTPLFLLCFLFFLLQNPAVRRDFVDGLRGAIAAPASQNIQKAQEGRNTVSHSRA